MTNNIILPQFNFSYNASYDLIFQELFDARKKSGESVSLLGISPADYPKADATKAKLLELQDRRDSNGVDMMNIITESLGLGRKQEQINCLVIGYCHLFGAMALPLTINSHYPRSIDFLGSVVVTHEMIHLIQQEHPYTKKPYCKAIQLQCGLDRSLGIHALVFAVQNIIFEKTARQRYIADIMTHYDGKGENKVREFIQENGSDPLLEVFQQVKHL